MLAPTLVGCVWFSIFGGAALYMEIFQAVLVAAAVKADVSTAMFALFSALPMGAVMSVAIRTRQIASK